MSRILLVSTAADSIQLADGTSHPTGFWAEELVVAHRDLSAAGHEVVLATPGGRRAPVDPGSLTAGAVGDAAKAADLAGYLARISEQLESPLVLSDAADAMVAGTDAWDAVVLPGGHGPMVDLARDADLGRLLIAADDAGIVIAPFCHGPAGLLSAVRDDGAFAFVGRRIAVFTDEEELSGGLGTGTPWLVATALAERGARVESGDAWTSHIVRDGNLISGQNPQSSEAVAAEVLRVLA